MSILSHRPTRLFVFLGSLFVACALIAEMIGVKIFHLEDALGLSRASFTLLGQENLSFALSVGVLPWPVIFIMTDVINDYYGVRGVRFLTLISVGLISFAFLIFHISISLPAETSWWLNSGIDRGVPDMQAAYSSIFGQGMNIIIGSLAAFAIGQLADALVFKQIKTITGDKRIWLRATGSTVISQLIDSFIVTYVAFWIFRDMSFAMASALAITAYMYKFIIAMLATPIIYLVHWAIERYLGKEEAEQLRSSALRQSW
jgi:uncharacterized integral membrane protein (TIGR00697 family)